MYIRAVLAGTLLLGLLVVSRIAGAEAVRDSLAPLARAVLPAVVTITAPGVRGPQDGLLPNLLSELFGEVVEEGRRQAVATGVILEPDGLVLTAAHAVSELGDLEVITADGVRRKATVLGLDRQTDVAVLRLAAGGPLPQAKLGDSEAVRVGDWVLAIGTPYGLGATVTGGIISALPRTHPVAAVDDLLQTDAATFSDSAGGPLVNAGGEVIGITTLLTAHNFGISFALPSNTARKIVSRLARDGAVRRGSLGARVQSLTPGLARALRRSEPGGLLISDVSPRGAAARAGLRAGDVVARLHGRNLETPYDVERILRDSSPAQTMELTYWRQGQVRASRVTLGTEVEQRPGRPFSSRNAAMLRFEVRALTPEMGVVVAHVRPDVPAPEAGLRPGDIIREINQEPVRTIDDFERLVDPVKPGDWLALLVQRGRTAVYVAVEARRADISAMPGGH
jgi:serine protease Do